MRAIAIIPARGGSKRIPRKNVRDFDGVPMISRPVGTLLESGLFDRIYVSSDSEEVLEIARGLGVETIERPPKLADDFTPTIPVIRHGIRQLFDRKILTDLDTPVMCVYPTNPLLAVQDLETGFQLMEDSLHFVAPVVKFSYPIQRALLLREGAVSFREAAHSLTRSQDLEETYHDAGQWYLAKASVWLEKKATLMQQTRALVLPPWKAYDIDTEEDWQMAEVLYRLSKSSSETESQKSKSGPSHSAGTTSTVE